MVAAVVVAACACVRAYARVCAVVAMCGGARVAARAWRRRWRRCVCVRRVRGGGGGGGACVCVCVCVFIASPIDPAREGDRDRVGRIAELAVAVVVVAACVCACACVWLWWRVVARV